MAKHLLISQLLAEANVPNSLVTKIYNICHQKQMNFNPVDDTTNFIGTVNTNITYQEYIDLIHEYFPNLTINTQGTYILFEDEYVLNKLLNAGFGDGTGISTATAATMNFGRDMFADDTTIESFNSFNKFTKHQSINTSFIRCTNLKSINLSALTGTPYNNMFRGCTSLTRINDLGTIITVSSSMFRDCTSLEYVHMPSTVKTLDSDAFYSCTSLTFQLSQLENIERINQDALTGTTIDCGNSKELYLPNLKIIRRNAFANHNEYNYINLPNLETMSGYGTFSNNKGLIEVKNLGKISEIENDSVNGIGAFKDCTSLLKVTLPTSFVKLPSYLFSGCTNLNTLNLSDISNNLIELGTGVFDNCNSLPRLYYFPNVTIDNGWRRMSNRQSIYEPKIKSTTKGARTRYGYINQPSYSHFNSGQSSCKYSTLYFRDIEKFGFATFCYVDVYSVIINNVTPPIIDTVDDPHEVLAIWNELVFANQDSANNNVDNIYVPDSAVNDYKAAPQYANVIDKIKPLSECPRITVEQAQQGITGLIEEYM